MNIINYTLRIERNNNSTEDKFETLNEALLQARRTLDDNVNHLKTTEDDEIIVYSEEYNEDDEVVDDTYIEYLDVKTKDYYDMDLYHRDNLFDFDIPYEKIENKDKIIYRVFYQERWYSIDEETIKLNLGIDEVTKENIVKYMKKYY